MLFLPSFYLKQYLSFVRFPFQKFSIVRNFTCVAIIGISGKKDSILIIVATTKTISRKVLHQTTSTNRTRPTCYYHRRWIFSFHAQGRLTVHCLSNVSLRYNYTISVSSSTTYSQLHHHWKIRPRSITLPHHKVATRPPPPTLPDYLRLPIQQTEDGLSQHKERDHFILSTQPGHSFGTTNCAFSTIAAKWRAWLSPLLPVAQPTSSQKHSCDHILLQKTSFFPTTAFNQQITTGDSLLLLPKMKVSLVNSSSH